MYRLITCTCITMHVPYTQTLGTTLVHQPANINGSLFPPYRLTSFKPTSLNFRSFPNKNITSFRSTRIYSTRGHVQHFFSNYTIVGGDARRDKAFLLTILHTSLQVTLLWSYCTTSIWRHTLLETYLTMQCRGKL